ncbi:ABC transporter substrate-binding protein [Limobrevibacterium gyesilva]|uniref:ABC transporter substrate-binding protein n=1 Tax=Limobrevibacterium gyesilva TaxID=2991712 RepID=A0AA42CF32_9PROT|nr:ABC transporter substrate-binding protein [Limobrevibacterium gyesilva]MCW3476044.1 ABC transporter substrate-binding protein [Limobrevibacterium gyesilva]
MLTRRSLLVASTATPFFSYAALAETPKDIIVIGKQIDDIISLDPQEAFEFTGGEVCGNCYQRLVVPDPANPSKIKGELAERWEVAPDGLSYTFHLKRDAKFASGKPVTAADAAFSLQRAVKLNKAPAFIVNQFGFTKDNVDGKIVAVDPYTLVLTIAEKQAPTFLFYCLSATVGSVVEKAVVMANAQGDDLGNGWLKTNSAGSGPFMLRSWKASESVILDPNPNARVPVKPKRVILRHIADPAAQLLQLQKGDIDIARDLQADQIKSVQGNPAFKITSAARSYIMYIALNQKHPELAKPQVRQAVKWAIDYAAIQKNITPTSWEVHQTFLPKGFPAAIDENPFHKDPAKAKALLAEAGLPNGFEITLDHASSQPQADIAQALQADLAAVGIKVALLSGESRQVVTKTRARQHQMALVSWGSDYFDPHSNAETFNINTDNSDNARNRTLAWRSAWQDKDLSDRAAANVKETDGEKRVIEYEKMQRDHQARSPFVLLLQSTEMAVMRKVVDGFEVAPMSARTIYEKISKT